MKIDMSDIISVIVPVYNVENYIEECVDSVLKQTYSNIEIILVDDGSTDNSGSICDAMAKKDKRIIVYHTDNQGVSEARNFALSKANGDYIAFVDGDDYILPEMLETLVNAQNTNKCSISICQFDFFYDATNRIEYSIDISGNEPIIFMQTESIKNMLEGKIFAGHLCNKLFKKELFDKVYLNKDIAIYEDLLACVEVFLKTDKVVFIPKKLYCYRMRENSAYNILFSDKKITAFKACDEIKCLLTGAEDGIIELVEKNKVNYGITLLSQISLKRLPTKNEWYKVSSNIRSEIKFSQFKNLYGKISCLCFLAGRYMFYSYIVFCNKLQAAYKILKKCSKRMKASLNSMTQ